MKHKIQALPVVWLFERSPIKAIVEKDISRWLQFNAPHRLGGPASENLCWLLDTENMEEFRNLLYYRIGSPAHWGDRVLLGLAKKLYPPLSHLRILTPSIGPGLVIKHGYGTVLQAERIGENCLIFQEVIIGFKDEGGGVPILGNHVHIAAGAKVLGSIMIGDNADIGANAVVTKNVPPNCTVAGVPARIIKRDGKRVNEPLV